MKKLHVTYSLISLIVLNVSAFGQDTTFLEPKQQYFSNTIDSLKFDKSHRLKGYPRVKYSRELIRLSNDKYKIENCFYYDNKRYKDNYSTFYEFKDDSIIVAKGEKWIYKQINDRLFSVYQNDSDIIEMGKVISLIPFVKQGDFVTKNKNGEVLFIEYFENGRHIKNDCPKKNLLDSVFTQVDELPKFPDKYGDLKVYIAKRLRFPEMAIESSISGKVFVKFVITKIGEIKNIEILRGFDPGMDKEAIKVIARLPNFEPGKIKGKEVNTYFVVPVNFRLD